MAYLLLPKADQDRRAVRRSRRLRGMFPGPPHSGPPPAAGEDDPMTLLEQRTRSLGVVATLGWAAALLLGLAGSPAPARACGGFFCGQVPVDQAAERLVFAVDRQANETTMIVQIAYQGAAPDFAWVLPLADVPSVESLDTFPQLALTALDANTGPRFQMPDDCFLFELDASAGGPTRAENEDGDDGVDVLIREEVGPYDVAVIASEDPEALVEWLRVEDFRVAPAMRPYIRLYTEMGQKFLALKLQADAVVSDIQPFRFTLPGTTPSIPLRMTAIAAEPEMGILVFVLGDERYTPANWAEVEIDDDRIVWEPNTWPTRTNWTALVAQSVDAVGGEGFVTEAAGPTRPYLDLARNGPTPTPEAEEARDALVSLLEDHPYLTRLYTRVSAEEMTSDPIFRPSAGGDVDRTRRLSRTVDGVDLCAEDAPRISEDPCAFVTCGAGGLCRNVADGETGRVEAACACVPGATARTTFDPMGRPTVICQDQRMSFLNPGDVTEDGERLPDPCVGFDCGEGRCVAVNMTPTCACDAGFVARGDVVDGERVTTCVAPTSPVPDRFYDGRLPGRPASLPEGRIVDVPVVASRAPAGGGASCGIGSAGDGAAGWSVAGPSLLTLLVAGRARRRRR